MYLKIDFESETPIYTQLRNQIVEGIALSLVKDGEALPSVRQMAEDIGINLHTVNKAYTLLKAEGFIKLDRRKGASINLNFDKLKENDIEKLKGGLRVIMAEAHCKKISKDEIVDLIYEIYSKYER
ncbi:MAG TPA: GntR family transcriptional regulator [Ruminiclostridium sp.]